MVMIRGRTGERLGCGATGLVMEASGNGVMASPLGGRVEEKVLELRRMVEERYPSVYRKRISNLELGVPGIDGVLGGGLPCYALSEIVTEAPSVGGQLALLALLQGAERRRVHSVLVDGSDAFDPETAGETLIRSLLWVRCGGTEEAMQAVDILARDRNFPLILLDLRWNAPRRLHRIASNVWYRLQRVVEQSSTTLVVFTPRPMVVSAEVRLKLKQGFRIESCEAVRNSLFALPEGEILRYRGWVGSESFISSLEGKSEKEEVEKVAAAG